MISRATKISYISLFSGCGGFDLGFADRYFECLGAYDIDPIVMEVHSKNLKNPTFVHDLSNIDLPGNLPNRIKVVIAGSPCQGFSTIGKRIVNDPRNKLLLVSGQVAIKYNADVLVCENVPGSNSGEHKQYWEELLKMLKAHGFSTQLVQYKASDFGVPQLRKRLILYAWRGKQVFDAKDFAPEKLKRSRLEFVFKDIEDTKNHNLNFIQKPADLLIAKKIKPGQKLCNVRGGDRSIHTWNIPEVFGKTSNQEREFLSLVMKLRRQIRRRKTGDADPVDKKILKSHFNGNTSDLIRSLLRKGYIREIDTNCIDLKNTFNGKYRRLDLSTLSPTVDTKFGSYKHFLHPTDNRALSVREAARIQGFDDSFIFSGSVQKQYQMIGNAVPPPLARFIANTVKDKFNL